jgi:16S rRNA (guanine966-N2)-methyltransferase
VRFALKSPADFVISQMSAEKNLLQFKKNYQHFSESEKEETIIFLDPPYNQIEIYQKVIQVLTEESWFFGQLWVESDYQKGLSQEQLIALGLKLDKIFEQGSSYLSVTNFPQQ